MKKVMIIVAALGIGIISKAQTVSFGVTGGYGHAYITNTQGDQKFNSMWNAGLSLVYSSNAHFGLGVDVKYSEEGNKVDYKTSVADGSLDAKSWINADYIRVPVKAIYFFGDNKSAIRPKIYAGPSIGFLTGGKRITEVAGVKTTSDTKETIKNFDFGATGGLGVNFKVAPRTWLNTDVAFYQGFIDMVKENGNTRHNGNIGANIGLLVGLGK